MPYDLVDHAIRKRKQRNEEIRKALLTRVFQVLRRAAPAHGFKKVIVFGSVARKNRFREDSDIDLAVPHAGSGNVTAFRRELEQFLERDVDIVELDRVHFGRWIEQEGILWKSKDSRFSRRRSTTSSGKFEKLFRKYTRWQTLSS